MTLLALAVGVLAAALLVQDWRMRVERRRLGRQLEDLRSSHRALVQVVRNLTGVEPPKASGDRPTVDETELLH